MRRIISVLLAIAMLFSCGIVAMAEEAATPAVGVEEMDFLARLGLMDAKAKPEATITRAEMAKIVMMCLGQSADLAPGETPFTDVNSSNQYSGYIQLANSFGIMVGSGDGTFDPNGNVTYNQMVKLLTHAIGHEFYAQAAGGYPGGYLITASNNEMLVGTTPSGEQAVSHGVAAILIKNALNIDIYERLSAGNGNYEYVTKPDVTILTKYFDIYEFQGVVTANGEASLAGTANIKDDQIILDGATTLNVGTTNVADYLGYLVKLYVKVDPEARYNTIVAAYPTENVVTEINAADVMNETTETLLVVLDEEGEEVEYDIDANADMIYNGTSKFWSAADLKGVFGTITMIDNDSDGDADVLVVYNYKNVIVSSVKPSDNIIKTKGETDPAWQSIEIDPESRSVNTTFVDTDGDEAYVEDLEEWNIVSIALSDDGTVMKAIVSYETLEGTVEAFGDDTITIDGTEYDYDATKVAPLTTSDFDRDAVFYLDFAGRIAAIDFEGATAGMDYGYLKAAGVSGTGFTRKVEMEILVTEGLTVFELAKEVKLNGTTISNEAVLENAAIVRGGNVTQQIIMYKQDDEGKITAIKTAQDGTEMTQEQRLAEFTFDYEMTGGSSTLMYLKNYQIFSGGYMIADNATCFVVPKAEEMETAEDEDYYVVPVKEVSNYAYMYMDGVKFYDINEDYEAEAVILDYKADSFDRGNASKGTNGLVIRMYKALNEEGDPITRLVLLNNTGMEIEIDIEENVKVATSATTLTNVATEDPANLVDGNLKAQLDVSALKTGDYITYGYDQKGNLNRLNLLFRAGNAPTDYIELDKGTLAPPTNYPDLYNRDYLAYAPITKVAKKAIIMTPMSAERVLPTTAKTVCFKYDTTTDEIEFIAKSDLAEGDLIFYDLEVNVIICID